MSASFLDLSVARAMSDLRLTLEAAPARPSPPAAGAAPRLAFGSETTFSVVSERAAFDALEMEWNDLAARAEPAPSVFQSFNWHWHWCNHFLDPRPASRNRLHILLARRQGRLVLVWPLVVTRRHGLDVLRWMGEPVGQYGDVILDADARATPLLEQAWRHLVQTAPADVIALRKVRGDAAADRVLARCCRVRTATERAPYVELAPGRARPDSQRHSAKACKNRRRLRRRLESAGGLGSVSASASGEAGRLAALAVDMKRAWLADRGLYSKALRDERFTRFLTDVATDTHRPTGCRVRALELAGWPIALQVAFAAGTTEYVHLTVYSLAHEKSGAGVLLLEDGLRSAAAEGLCRVDLLAPADDYKLGWADGCVRVDDWAHPITLRGRIYAAGYLAMARGRLKAVARELPRGLRRLCLHALRLT